MAENKKAFVLYADLIHTLEKLPDDKAGILFKHILRYVNDLNPIAEDTLVDIIFEPVKQQLKRDLRKYEDKKKQWSEAGKASAEAKRLAKETNEQQTPTNVETVQPPSTVSTVIVKVKDKDTVKDKVSVFNNTIMPSADFLKIIEQNEDDHIWMEKLIKKFGFESAYQANLYVNLSFRKHIQESVIDKGDELNFTDFKHVRNASEKWYKETSESKQATAKRKFVQ